jgi:hypothetical protein
MKKLSVFVLISAKERGEARLEAFIRRRFSPRLKSYLIDEGPRRVGLHLRASLPKVNLVIEFSEDSDKNQKLCDLLKSTIDSRSREGKTPANIEQVILCYSSNKLPAELEIAQEWCLDNHVPYHIMWEKPIQELASDNGLYPFNAINLQINMDDIPKAKFLTEIGIEPMLIPEGLANGVFRDRVIEERFWYWDEKAAAAYLYLKESRNYPVFFESFDLLRRSVLQIVRKTFDVLKASVSDYEGTILLDLVALGVGSAEKELTILEEIFNHYHLRQIQLDPGEQIHYVPVDISFPLLQNSLRSIYSLEELRNELIKGSLRVNPILTDILRLHASQIRGNENKLVAALGLLWNIPIQNAFHAFQRIVTQNDLLLIDAEFLGDRTDEELKDSYRGKEIDAFCFHPLEMLNQAAQTKEKFRTTKAFNRSMYMPYSEFYEYYLKNGKIKVEIVDGPTPSKLLADYNLPESARNHLQFGPLKYSKSVIIMFVPKNKRLSPVIMAYSTRFEYNEFIEYIQKTGFQIIQDHLNNDIDKPKSTFGYFLLAPPSAKKRQRKP